MWNYPDGCTPEMVDASFGKELDEIYDPLIEMSRMRTETVVTRATVLSYVFQNGVSDLIGWIAQDEKACTALELFFDTQDLDDLDVCLDRIAEAATGL